MAVRDLRARLALDGEAEYKRALGELASGNKVLSSEMRKLQAEYKGNTDSIEYLTQRGDILERQLLTQHDKVEVLRRKVAEAAKAWGEADTETQKYITQLNNAEAQEYELQHAIEDNNAALQGQGEAMSGLGDTVSSLASKLGIQLPESATKALNGMQGLSSGTVAAMGVAAAGVVAVTKVVKELHDVTIQTAADVDEVITESMVTGLSTRTIQQLQYAENLIDVSYSTITGSLTKLTKNMAAAQNGNEDLAKKFEDLGVSITDTNDQLRSAEDVFFAVIDRLGEVENGTERDALAMELMGKSAQELNPLILQGSDALKALADEAEATGYVLDESQIAKLGEVDDAYQRMQLTVEAGRKQLAEDFAPASVEAMDLFSKAVSSGAELLDKSGIVTNLASILESLGYIGEDVIDLIKAIPGLDQALGGLKITLGAVAQFCALIADTTDAVIGLLTLDAGRFTTALGWNAGRGQASHWQKTYMQQSGTWDQYASYYGLEGSKAYIQEGYGYDSQTGRYYDTKTGNYIVGTPVAPGWNASGNDNWRGGLTYWSEAGPEMAILPSGTRILSAQDTRKAAAGTQIFYVTIDAKSVKEFNDIVELAQSEQVRSRMAGEEA